MTLRPTTQAGARFCIATNFVILRFDDPIFTKGTCLNDTYLSLIFTHTGSLSPFSCQPIHGFLTGNHEPTLHVVCLAMFRRLGSVHFLKAWEDLNGRRYLLLLGYTRIGHLIYF